MTMENSIPPVGTLVDALVAPAETLRLVVQCRDALRHEGNSWADFFANDSRRKIEDGSYHGVLWTGPGDEAVALASWEFAGDLGRRATVYLAEGYQRRAVLESFLARLESAATETSSFVSWADDIPGISEANRNTVFSSRGFSPVVRADMRLPKGINLPRVAVDPEYSPRRLKLDDEPQIADLFFRTYAESPERALFATSLDRRLDARRGIHDLLYDGVGRWLSEASFGIEKDGRLIAQTLANELEGGLITEVGVDPSFRRRGLARRLLPLTIDGLRAAGFDTPRLIVTMWNPGAVRLYESLGFEFVPGGSARVWLNLPALGVLPGPAHRA
jgi:ribosomal protein S18 acetylase RimI-like enzyme